MFRYINMPTLVAYFLREFAATKSTGAASVIYLFTMCLCLPFVSKTFYRARLIALGIAECTNSADQIARLINHITGATIQFDTIVAEECMVVYDGTTLRSGTSFIYDGPQTAAAATVPYSSIRNISQITIQLNGASRAEVDAYLDMLIPFYIKTERIYK